MPNNALKPPTDSRVERGGDHNRTRLSIRPKIDGEIITIL